MSRLSVVKSLTHTFRFREDESTATAQIAPSHQHLSKKKPSYATLEDFKELFAATQTELLCLSLHLTADAEDAEVCLIRALKDCMTGFPVPKERMHIRARQMVVWNSVRLVLGSENTPPDDSLGDAVPYVHLETGELQAEELRESTAILDLPTFDRLVFVITVLERYSIRDCALLLRSTPKKVRDARLHALNHVISGEGHEHLDTFKAFPVSAHGVCSDERGRLDGTSGTVLN